MLLLLTPGASAAGAEYQLFFSEQTARFASDGLAAEGETRGFRFVVAQPNVTRVEFVLTWTETGDSTGLSAPDAFTLRAADPSGRDVGAPVRSASGEARLVASGLGRVPEDASVRAEDVDARMAAATTQAGVGEWRAWVKLEDTGNPQGASFDNDNRFQLVAIIHHYEGVAMRVVSLEKPAGAAGILAATEGVPLVWTLGISGLLVAACGLGVAIYFQSRRRVTVRVSPDGENTDPAGR